VADADAHDARTLAPHVAKSAVEEPALQQRQNLLAGERPSVDVSTVALDLARRHAEGTSARFELASAVDLPFPDSSIDLVFSVEVMEHLHPSDARAHLREAARVLRPRGRYWVLTPNRLVARSAAERFGVEGSSPDDDIHLKEWTYAELAVELRSAGFVDLRSPWRSRHFHRLPLLPVAAKQVAERLVRALPSQRARRHFAAVLGVSNCSLVAWRL
jgi:SAM-dependent methyltransferase